MKTKKIASMVIVLVVLSLTILPFAHAATVIIGEYDFTNEDNGAAVYNEHPSANAQESGYGQTFNASQSGYITAVTVELKKEGTPTGYLICELRGTGNDLAGPANATNYETASNVVSIAGLTTSYVNYTFYFAGSTLLYQYQAYAFVIYAGGLQDLAADKVVRIGMDSAGETDEGVLFGYKNSAWAGTYTQALVYEVTATTTGTEPLPTVEPIGEQDLDELITSLMNVTIPLMVMLLPSLILWWFGGRGKWPLLIGLAIGTALGKVFIADFPLWLVFLVAIGIIGMAYSDVSSGGSYT